MSEVIRKLQDSLVELVTDPEKNYLVKMDFRSIKGI